MEEFYHAVYNATFLEIADELVRWSNMDETGIKVVVDSISNDEIFAWSYLEAIDDPDDGGLFSQPQYLADLGFLESLNQDGIQVKPVEVRILIPGKGAEGFWTDFIFHLKTKFIKLDDYGSKPWLQIPDSNWDRRAVEFWHKGYSCGQIANTLERSEKTIRNRLSTLRKIYGDQIVPFHRRK